MARRKRNSFARMGIVCVVLMMALGSMGTAYSVWSDTLSISGTVSTAIVDTRIIWSHSQAIPDDEGGYINVSLSDLTIDIHFIDVRDGVDYYGYFSIKNNTDSLPVKIQSIMITPAVADWQTTYGFNGSVTFDDGTKTPVTVIGEQIDPGERITAKVHVYLDGADQGDPPPEPPFNFDVTIVVNVVPWNQ